MKRNVSKEKLAKKLADELSLDQGKFDTLSIEARKAKKTFFQMAMEKGAIEESVVIKFLSRELHIPLINLPSLRITSELVKVIPKKLIERYQILPIGKVGSCLTIVTSNPFELMLRDDIKEVLKCTVCFVLSTPKVISTAIEGYYGESSNLDEILEDINEDDIQVVAHAKDGDGEGGGKGDSQGADDAPVIRLVNLLLSEGIKARASDIHFEPYEKNFRVRYRIDGALKEAYSHSRDMYTAMVARLKIMATLDITEKRVPQDGRFRVRIQQKEIDFRVSMLPIYHGEKVVLRVLDKSSMKTGLNNLGFSEKPTAAFADAIKRPYGMILVTGPTGSGKSTTLYTILNTMNTPDRNIMTVEDPVEYQVEGITQTQVHASVGLTFASGLRSLLRQSPDIILVGEMRDFETADIGVKAALTGHLVFSTLHTNSASGAMTRLVDMGVEPFLIASSCVAVAAQRLIKKICQFCKEPYEIPDEVLRRCKVSREDLKGVESFHGKGCAKCNETGYFGRLACIEVLKVDPKIQELILARASSDEVQEAAVAAGMETLFENAFGLFKKGLTTLDEVLRVSSKE